MGRTFPHKCRPIQLEENHLGGDNMSEQEIVKNYPGSSEGHNHDGQGAFASGAVGSATTTGPDGNLSPAASLGNIATANFGVTSGANAVNPTGTPGGILAPEQARRFIDYVWDATVLAKDGRRVTMRANTMEIEKVNVGERVIRAAAQADATYTNAGATFTKVELTTKKIRLDWEVSTESLEDNIEGGALEDHLVRLMTNAFANDIEDLAINGDGSTGNFLSIMEGFVNKVTTGSDAHEAIVTVSDDEWTPTVMQDIILAMPRKYRAIKSNLKFYAGTDAFQGIVKNNGTLADAVAEAIAGMTPGSTQANRQNYLDGVGQTLGGARTTRVLGVDVMEVPYYPADYVDLTFPANRVWGFQRDITVNREYKPKKDTIEYTVFVRFGIQWEEQDAVSYADAAVDPTA
jgi:HK97 family phage major capsid protein